MAFLKIDLEENAKAISQIVLDELLYKGRTLRQWADAISKPKTNADKIRAMTDEELMTWIMEMQACPYELYQDCQHPNYDCETCIKDWLRQEAEE